MTHNIPVVTSDAMIGAMLGTLMLAAADDCNRISGPLWQNHTCPSKPRQCWKQTCMQVG